MDKKFFPGDDVWIVTRDEDGIIYDISGYMFIAEVCGFAIVSAYINDLETIEQTLKYMAIDTAENYDTDVSVFPLKDVYREQEDAQSVYDAELNMPS